MKLNTPVMFALALVGCLLMPRPLAANDVPIRSAVYTQLQSTPAAVATSPVPVATVAYRPYGVYYRPYYAPYYRPYYAYRPYVYPYPAYTYRPYRRPYRAYRPYVYGGFYAPYGGFYVGPPAFYW